MSSHSLIELHQLTKTFGLQFALREVSATIERGVTTALLGANGSGKTTLLRILTALSSPTKGKVLIGGWSLPKEANRVRAQIGFVGHLPLVYEELSAEENLAFFGGLYGVAKDDLAQRVPALLDRVGLGKRARDRAGTFSRGMLQRLSLARCMAHDPAILLLDEPYTGLDARGMVMLDGLLHEWRAAGKTIVITLHDIAHAAQVAQRALILRAGRLAADVPEGEMGRLPEVFAEVSA